MDYDEDQQKLEAALQSLSEEKDPRVIVEKLPDILGDVIRRHSEEILNEMLVFNRHIRSCVQKLDPLQVLTLTSKIKAITDETGEEGHTTLCTIFSATQQSSNPETRVLAHQADQMIIDSFNIDEDFKVRTFTYLFTDYASKGLERQWGSSQQV